MKLSLSLFLSLSLSLSLSLYIYIYWACNNTGKVSIWIDYQRAKAINNHIDRWKACTFPANPGCPAPVSHEEAYWRSTSCIKVVLQRQHQAQRIWGARIRELPPWVTEAVLMSLFMSYLGYIYVFFTCIFHPLCDMSSSVLVFVLKLVLIVFVGFLWSIYGWQGKSDPSYISRKIHKPAAQWGTSICIDGA